MSSDSHPNQRGPSTAQIEEQVARISGSQKFSNSPMLKKFLKFVVRQTLEKKQHQISSYSIATTALGRPIDFDPGVDPIVRIQAGRLRKALDCYYSDTGADDAVRISIPKGGYIPIFEANRSDARTSQNQDSTLPRKGNYRPTIAVFTFDESSTDDAHLATGLATQIVASLSTFQAFKTLGPISHVTLSDMVHQSAQELGADYHLTGTIRSDGTHVRSTIVIGESSTGEIIWSKSFNLSLDVFSLFEMEDQIADETAALIAADTGVINAHQCRRLSSKRPQSLSSYESILYMHHYSVHTNAESFCQAWQALEATVESDPDFALAKAHLADIYAIDYFCNTGLVDDGLQRALQLAEQAYSLSPECQIVRWVTGELMMLTGKVRSGVRHLEQAIAINPHNAHVLATSAFFLFMSSPDNRERAYQLTTRATKLNPSHPNWYAMIPCLYHYFNRDYLAAAQEAEKLTVAGMFWGDALRAACYGRLGDSKRSQRNIDSLLEAQPEFEANGRELLKRLLMCDESVADLTEGLDRAGLNLVPACA